jgi:hypothetical protein
MAPTGKISLTGYRGTWVSPGQQRGNIGHSTMIIIPVPGIFLKIIAKGSSILHSQSE